MGVPFGSFFLTASVTSIARDHPSSRTLNVFYPSMKWMFPSTSLRKKARLHGVKLFSWFDVYSVQNPSFREETQIEELSQSDQYLREVIDAEREVLKNAWGGVEEAEKMIFGRLSQGCAMSLAALLGLD
jgi:Phospholipase/Carboxylesterase